jgi:hypothetical protein
MSTSFLMRRNSPAASRSAKTSRNPLRAIGIFLLLMERDDFTFVRHPAPGFWWSMIFSENRYPLFGIML